MVNVKSHSELMAEWEAKNPTFRAARELLRPWHQLQNKLIKVKLATQMAQTGTERPRAGSVYDFDRIALAARQARFSAIVLTIPNFDVSSILTLSLRRTI